jgi:tape measure domain-containing protein
MASKDIEAGRAYVLIQLRDKVTAGLQHVERSFASFGRNFATLGATFAAVGGAGLLWPGKLSADMEMLQVSFEVMLGSAGQAQSLLAKLADFAKKTPFTMTDLASNAQLLLNYGVSAGAIMPSLQALGDVAAGDAEKFSRLALAFGQTQAKGRLMGQEVLQMTEAGFNPLQVISKATGRSMLQLSKDMEEGKISAQMVSQAFALASGPGGKFHGMMDKMSATTRGLLSTLLDSVQMGLQPFGEAVNGILKPLLRFGISAADAVGAFLKANKGLATAAAAVLMVITALGLGLIAIGGAAMAASSVFGLLALVWSISLNTLIALSGWSIIAGAAQRAYAAAAVVSRAATASLAAVTALLNMNLITARMTALASAVATGIMSAASRVAAATMVAYRMAVSAVSAAYVALRARVAVVVLWTVIMNASIRMSIATAGAWRTAIWVLQSAMAGLWGMMRAVTVATFSLRTAALAAGVALRIMRGAAVLATAGWAAMKAATLGYSMAVGLATVMTSILSGGISFLLGPFAILALALVGAGYAAYRFRDQIGGALSSIIGSALSWGRSIVASVWGAVQGIYTLLSQSKWTEALQLTWLAMVAGTLSAMAMVGEAFSIGLDYLSSWIPGVDSVRDYLQSAFGSIYQAILSGQWDLAGQIMMTKLQLVWLTGWNFMRDSFDLIITGIKSAWLSVADTMSNIWTSMINGIAKGIVWIMEKLGLASQGTMAELQRIQAAEAKQTQERRNQREDPSQAMYARMNERQKELDGLRSQLGQLEGQAAQGYADAVMAGDAPASIGDAAAKARERFKDALAAVKKPEADTQSILDLGSAASQSQQTTQKIASLGTFSGAAAGQALGINNRPNEETAANTRKMRTLMERQRPGQAAFG